MLRVRRRTERRRMAKVPIKNVASVWCGVMPRVGSRSHIRYCQDCRRVRKRYWQLVREQSAMGRR